MKVAVITAYHQLDDELIQCINSVQGQSYDDCTHIMIGDGCELPSQLQHEHLLNISLPKNINDYGDSPRSLGVVYAKAIGAEAAIFLDSDNWLESNHIELMVNTAEINSSDIVTCPRILCHLDGTPLGECQDSNGITFCDTNCMLVRKKLFSEMSSAWLIPDELHAIGDRILWDRLIHATKNISSLGAATVYYRTGFIGHYQIFNIPPPLNAKSGAQIRQFRQTIEELIHRSFNRMKTLGRL